MTMKTTTTCLGPEDLERVENIRRLSRVEAPRSGIIRAALKLLEQKLQEERSRA